ncbi:MAG: peptide chain release factor N(5)-glutamine methyltransferase, partial [Candidatus Ornithospirochaeta sp.]
MTLGELKAKMKETMDDLEDPILERRVILSFLGVSPIRQITDANSEIPDALSKDALELSKKRASGWPMAYITGEKEFWGMTFRVTPEVLIPRPDTETLVETGLKIYRENGLKGRVLDLCTGSGAVGTAFRKESGVSSALSDISPEALKIAKENYRTLTGEDADARDGDLFSPWRGEKFSLILSNPPYLTKEWCEEVSPDVRKEPLLALYGYGDDGLDIIRRIITEAKDHLETGGFVAMECDYRQCT